MASGRRRAARLRVAAVAGVVAVCVAVALRSQWREVAAAEWHFAPGALTLATILLGLSYVLVAWLWGMALATRTPLGVRRGARIWFLANLARYVPGSVWSYVGAVELARREGANRHETLAIMALTQALSVGVAVLIGLPVLAGERASLGRAVLFGGAAVVGGVVLLVAARRPLLRLLARRFPGVSLRDLVPPPALAARLTAGYVLYWAVAGLAFAVFVRSLHPLATADLPAVVAAYAAAYAAGFLGALVTPAGLGVREAVLVVALSGVLPSGPAVAVAIASRLWMTLAELAGAGLAHVLAGRAAVGKDRDGDAARPARPG
jgi:glycosyltransferase 2 family protein